MKNRSSHLKFTLLGLVFFCALGYLFLSGMESSMVYYLTLQELISSPPERGEGVRLAGWVKKGSISGSALEGEVSFTITDGERELPVVYTGQVPDTFEDGAEVVIEGVFTGRSVFEAASMLAKCPSKYESASPVNLPDRTL